MKRIPSQNQETEANIFPEGQDAAEADIEHGKGKPPAGGPPPGFAPADFPDGGREAWLTLLGAWCCLYCSFGWINCIGIFQEVYERDQLRNYSSSAVAWIPSAELFMMFAGGIVFGKVYDNHGPKWLLLGGSFAHVFGLMMVSLCKEYYQFFLAQSVVSALGASAIFYAALNPVTTWFFQKRGMAFGIMASGSSLGGVLMPILISRILPKVGFGWTMRIVAFFYLGLLIVANLTVKSRLPPRPKPLELAEFTKPFHERTFFLFTLASFLFTFGTFIPFNFVILSGLDYGMSANLASYLVPILNAASIFGRILPGIFGDKFGRYNTLIIMNFLSTILVLAVWLPARGNIPIIIFAAFYGFTSGAFVSLLPSCVAQISDVREIGVRTGVIWAVASLAALTGSPIAGALLNKGNLAKYLPLQLFCGLSMAVGCVFYVMSRHSQVGWKWAKV
jgi:MFS family permease